MLYNNLPIFKSCLDFVVYIEKIVKNFERYYKYTIGVDLRNHSKKLLFLIHKANIAKNDRVQILHQLRDKCEEVKMLIVVSKKLEAFNSFKSFEHSSKLIVDICKQAQSWLNSTARTLK